MKIKIYDISATISEKMAVYKDNPAKKPVIAVTRTLKDGANESRISLDSHTGTHADAPYHMLEGGKKINEIGLERFIGECIVIDLINVKDSIGEADLRNAIIRKNDIVLLKTKDKPDEKFDYSFTYLNKEGAKYLASLGVKAVGIDSLGIERNQPMHETHKTLLGKNIQIIEGLELSKIKKGRYFFIALPLKVWNADGAPVRAMVMKGIGLL